MSPEASSLPAYVETFAGQWRQAETAGAREIARRSYIVSVLLLAEQANQEGVTLAEESVAAAGLRAFAAQRPLWAARQRLVFASLRSSPRRPMPTPLELLDSLQADDGRYVHDLHVPVP